MQDKESLSKVSMANVVFFLTSFAGKKISASIALNSKVSFFIFKLFPKLSFF
jgi:hypothetical protein